MPSPQPSATGNSLVASAARLQGKPDISKVGRKGRGWQNLAWEFYDTVGEFRYVADWVGAMLSKATLYPVRIEPDGTRVRIEDGPAADAVNDLYGGPDGQSEMLRLSGIHATVAGEWFLVGEEGQSQDDWEIYAATEITARAGRWYSGGKQIGKNSEPLIIRIWRPHPVRPKESTAPSRAVLPILSEIVALTKHVAAQVDSRLAGAGLLFMPNEVRFPTTTTTNAEGETTSVEGDLDSFVADLTDAMVTAISDQSDASALVPMMVQIPGDQVGNIQHMTFWTPLDEHAKEMRDEALRRLGLGLDIPPEIMSGVAETNHWSAWQMDESAIKAHTEPLLKIITNSLTTGYLTPYLKASEVDEPYLYAIEADTSGLRLRPNRSKEALELYDRGELDGQAMRRETGFGDEDALDADELARWVMLQIIKGNTSADPTQVQWALDRLGLPGAPTATENREPRESPSLEEHPTNSPPQVEALVPSAAACVYRALERAGNKIKVGKKIEPPEGVSACDLYRYGGVDNVDFLMKDAWTYTDRVADSLGVDPERFISALDRYTRTLLSTGAGLDTLTLTRYLEASLR